MTTIEVTPDELIIRPIGLDALWSFKRRVAIPLAHVRAVRSATEDARGWFHGLRMPGTEIPGMIRAGTFYRFGERVFWNVHGARRAIAVELIDERYKRLIVEVSDPQATIARIEAALQPAASGPVA